MNVLISSLRHDLFRWGLLKYETSGIFLPEFFSFWLLIWFCYGNRIVLYALTLLSLLSLQPRMWLTLENIKVFCEIQKFPVMIDTFYKCQLCQLIDDDVLVWSTRSDFLLPALSMTEKGTGDQLLYLIIYLDIADLLGGFCLLYFETSCRYFHI